MDPYNQRKGTMAKHQVGMGQDIYEIIILTSYFRVHMGTYGTRKYQGFEPMKSS